MGQQQILLLALVSIILGIVYIVAANVFGNSIVNSNRDAVRQDLFYAAANAQNIYTRPLSIDGISRDFNNIENDQLISQINIPGIRNGEIIKNENGLYSILVKLRKNCEFQVNLFQKGRILKLLFV